MRILLIIILVNSIGVFQGFGYSQELDRSEFLPSSLVSREIAQKQLNKINNIPGKFKHLNYFSWIVFGSCFSGSTLSEFWASLVDWIFISLA